MCGCGRCGVSAEAIEPAHGHLALSLSRSHHLFSHLSLSCVARVLLMCCGAALRGSSLFSFFSLLGDSFFHGAAGFWDVARFF